MTLQRRSCPFLSEDEIARQMGMERSAVVDLISRGRKKLLDSRNRRQKPFIDNALYTGLNGLGHIGLFEGIPDSGN